MDLFGLSADTIVVTPPAEGIKGDCLQNPVCKAQYDSVHASMVKVTLVRGEACDCRKFVGGCTTWSATGATITVIPTENRRVELLERGVPKPTWATTTHELKHPNGCQTWQSERTREACARNTENKVRKAARVDTITTWP